MQEHWELRDQSIKTLKELLYLRELLIAMNAPAISYDAIDVAIHCIRKWAH